MPKMAPLAELKTLDATTYVFDPENVVVLYTINRLLPDGMTGSLTLHVWGIAAKPLPISGTPQAFLDSLKIADQFVTLTGNNGPLQVRATAISFLLSHEPGVDDPTINCSLHLGSDPTSRFYVHEDVGSVRRLVDGIRTKPSPSKMSTRVGRPTKTALSQRTRQRKSKRSSARKKVPASRKT